jgi:hypothetical protein
MEEGSRESLFLMNDAGFDVNAAPLAWWTLAQKKGQPLEATPLPEPARYMYTLLGTEWQSAAPGSNQRHAFPNLSIREPAAP